MKTQREDWVQKLADRISVVGTSKVSVEEPLKLSRNICPKSESAVPSRNGKDAVCSQGERRTGTSSTLRIGLSTPEDI